MKPAPSTGDAIFAPPLENVPNESISGEVLPGRQMHSRRFEPESSETKDFKTHFSLNPDVKKRLQAIVPLGKSNDQPQSYCSLASSNGPSDSSNAAAISSSQASTGSSSTSISSSSSGSSSSSSSSSSFSSSNAEDAPTNQQQTLPSFASAPAVHSSSDNTLPTNADYYSIAASETQSNNDLNSANQHSENQEAGTFDTGYFGHHKKAWAHFMKAPAHMVQKWRKFHADLTGKGALYGSDYFADDS